MKPTYHKQNRIKYKINYIIKRDLDWRIKWAIKLSKRTNFKLEKCLWKGCMRKNCRSCMLWIFTPLGCPKRMSGDWIGWVYIITRNPPTPPPTNSPVASSKPSPTSSSTPSTCASGNRTVYKNSNSSNNSTLSTRRSRLKRDRNWD